jgi:hypothetical protein
MVFVPWSSAVCLSGFLVSLVGEALQPPVSKARPKERRMMAVFGKFIFLTVQTNALNAAYHALALVSALAGSPAGLEALVWRLFPLTFGLAALLTPLYYALDHFQPQKRIADQEKIEDGFRLVPLANHICHAHALPLAILSACCFERPAPAAMDAVVPIALYSLWYLNITLVNKWATGEWAYAFMEVAERRAGRVGVPALVAVVAVTLSLLGFAGCALVRACGPRAAQLPIGLF